MSINILPPPLPPASPHIEISAYIRGDYLFIEHMGGEALKYSRTRVIVKIGNEYRPKPPLIERNSNGLWECGEYLCYPYSGNLTVSVMVVDEDSNTILLHGQLRRGETEWIGAVPPLLVSTLRTNSDDEDLTCYALSQQNFNAITYIYNWKKDGTSIYEVLLPFDTQSNSVSKDYSGNGYNATVDGAVWIASGKIGGAYSFDGNSGGLVCSLPSLFRDWSKSFTITFWMYSKDIESDSTRRCVCEVYVDQNNSLQVFQYNSSLQVALKLDGIERSRASSVLNNNTWYFVAVVWNGSDLTIFINGTECPPISGDTKYQSGNTPSLTIGYRSDRSNIFYGYIDEFYIYRYARTSNQIYQDYMDMRNGSSAHRTLVADETSIGDTWSCTITPNDSTGDAEPIDSNMIVITAYEGGIT